MLDQPDIRPVKESGELYRVNAPYTFETLISGKRNIFTVPEGFQYDGASVPRFAWTLIGFLPDGIHRAAALAHDYLYESKGYANGQSYDRKFADSVLYHMMKECGVKSWHAYIAYVTVRALGRLDWKD